MPRANGSNAILKLEFNSLGGFEALRNFDIGSAALCELIESLSYVEHVIKMRFRTSCGLDLRCCFIGAPRSRGNQKYAKQHNRF